MTYSESLTRRAPVALHVDDPDGQVLHGRDLADQLELGELTARHLELQLIDGSSFVTTSHPASTNLASSSRTIGTSASATARRSGYSAPGSMRPASVYGPYCFPV